MSRRAVPVRVYLLILASAGFVAAPLLDVCHHPAAHDGHGHVHAAVAAHGNHQTPIATAGHGEAASPALGADHASIPSHHDDHLACFTATLQAHPEFLLGVLTALGVLVSATRPSLLALGPATPPP